MATPAAENPTMLNGLKSLIADLSGVELTDADSSSSFASPFSSLRAAIVIDHAHPGAAYLAAEGITEDHKLDQGQRHRHHH